MCVSKETADKFQKMIGDDTDACFKMLGFDTNTMSLKGKKDDKKDKKNKKDKNDKNDKNDKKGKKIKSSSSKKKNLPVQAPKTTAKRAKTAPLKMKKLQNKKLGGRRTPTSRR